uniref:Uncharacterized protein n=1 Tax=Anguilla anguilla TaxID=7936 RepID=A0A0E9T8Q7_ANGAN
MHEVKYKSIGSVVSDWLLFICTNQICILN